MEKNLIAINDLSKKELLGIIKLGMDIKKNPQEYSSKLNQRTMAMWFEKPSLRTRVSFEAAMTQLGGHAIYLDTSTTHKKAHIKDEVKCLSSYADIIAARVFEHETIIQMKSASTAPVINALCNRHHPCQAMADVMTVFENFKNPFDVTLAYVGDGNNVCNSLIQASKKIGIRINVATPIELKPMFKPDFWSKDPREAVKEADIVYTDTWVSMGEENREDEKTILLKGYQVNKRLIGNRYFMHCLPAVRGQEVTDEVIDSKKSLVFQQAENRLHIQKAIILKLSA